jgi:D-alanyl-D-alanine carboxypeptidase (penicillin-binding protein 5/6)/beta-lactamase class A
MRFVLALCLLISLCPLCLCGESPSLEARLAPLAKAHKGKVAVAVKNLTTGEGYYLNADEPMPTASLIKLPVMVEVYAQAAEGKVRLDDLCILEKVDMVPGSGVLTEHFSPGATFTLRDAVRMMIVFSDNTATNLVLDHIGIPSTNTRMESLGLKETKLNAKVFRGSTTSINKERSKKYGLGSTTARDMVTLLELIEKGKVVSPDSCKQMLEHLKKCDDKDKFPRFLPAGVAVAHKTGSVNDARTDAGILYLKSGPVAVCVMTNDNEDKTWRADNAGNLLCARVAKEVADYFSAPKAAAQPVKGSPR